MAAEQGNYYAQYNPGIHYNAGMGVTQDYVQAHKWFNLAVAQKDDPSTRESIDAITSKMTPEQIATAQKLVSKWRPKTWKELNNKSAK